MISMYTIINYIDRSTKTYDVACLGETSEVSPRTNIFNRALSSLLIVNDTINI